jgi:hypothetical protein
MADAPVVYIGENSPERVAYLLFSMIANVEKRTDSRDSDGDWKTMDRKWILDTYTECIKAVRGHRHIEANPR